MLMYRPDIAIAGLSSSSAHALLYVEFRGQRDAPSQGRVKQEYQFVQPETSPRQALTFQMAVTAQVSSASGRLKCNAGELSPPQDGARTLAVIVAHLELDGSRVATLATASR